MKQKGFRKNGNNFRKFQSGEVSNILYFQRSMFNSAEECRFSLNVGLYFQRDPENRNLLFKEYECPVRTRADGISPRYDSDQWWTINAATDTEALYAELYQLIEEDILPWLEQFESRRDVIRAGQAGKLEYMIWGNLYE